MKKRREMLNVTIKSRERLSIYVVAIVTIALT